MDILVTGFEKLFRTGHNPNCESPKEQFLQFKASLYICDISIDETLHSLAVIYKLQPVEFVYTFDKAVRRKDLHVQERLNILS